MDLRRGLVASEAQAARGEATVADRRECVEEREGQSGSGSSGGSRALSRARMAWMRRPARGHFRYELKQNNSALHAPPWPNARRKRHFFSSCGKKCFPDRRPDVKKNFFLQRPPFWGVFCQKKCIQPAKPYSEEDAYSYRLVKKSGQTMVKLR